MAAEPTAGSPDDSEEAADAPASSDGVEAADAPTNPPDGFTPKIYGVPKKTSTAHVRSR